MALNSPPPAPARRPAEQVASALHQRTSQQSLVLEMTESVLWSHLREPSLLSALKEPPGVRAHRRFCTATRRELPAPFSPSTSSRSTAPFRERLSDPDQDAELVRTRPARQSLAIETVASSRLQQFLHLRRWAATGQGKLQSAGPGRRDRQQHPGGRAVRVLAESLRTVRTSALGWPAAGSSSGARRPPVHGSRSALRRTFARLGARLRLATVTEGAHSRRDGG